MFADNCYLQYIKQINCTVK